MKQLESDAIINGANFVYRAEVYGCKKIDNGYEISMHDADGKDFSFTTEKVINSAGLSADTFARIIGITDPEYTVFYWKGEYFSVGNGKHKLINRLIYPVPEKNRVGLGIHTTIDLDGRVKLGPNALYLESGVPEYSIDPEHASQFFNSVHKFLPFLEPGDLYPDQAGVRPKLQQPGDPVRDFLIREESDRELPGFINLLGIESPGLTAALAIAEYVTDLIFPDAS
jgi:L-2-hydroxyglutarate oxidase LhgO